MVEISEHLARIERGQAATHTAINGLTEVMQINNAMLVQLTEWLTAPPSSDLPDTIAGLVASIGELRLAVHKISEAVNLLPERVAKAVIDGELPSRG